jgi:hypothetical protein
MYLSGSDPVYFTNREPDPRSGRAIHKSAVNIYHNTMDIIAYCKSLREVVEETNYIFGYVYPQRGEGVSIKFGEPATLVVQAWRPQFRTDCTVPIEIDKMTDAEGIRCIVSKTVATAWESSNKMYDRLWVRYYRKGDDVS